MLHLIYESLKLIHIKSSRKMGIRTQMETKRHHDLPKRGSEYHGCENKLQKTCHCFDLCGGVVLGKKVRRPGRSQFRTKGLSLCH